MMILTSENMLVGYNFVPPWTNWCPMRLGLIPAVPRKDIKSNELGLSALSSGKLRQFTSEQLRVPIGGEICGRMFQKSDLSPAVCLAIYLGAAYASSAGTTMMMKMG
jgi:hypothetical protein